MFDKIFSLPSAVARHKAAPLSEERRRFLAQLDRQGYKPGHLAQTAVDLLRLVPAIQLLADGVHDTAGVEAVIARFVRQRHGRVLPYLRKTLRRLLKQWLRFFGCWKDPTPAAGPLWTLYRDFLNWLEHERGFSVGSLKNRKYSLLTFLRWWEPKNRPLFCLRVVDLDDFLAACHAQGLSASVSSTSPTPPGPSCDTPKSDASALLVLLMPSMARLFIPMKVCPAGPSGRRLSASSPP